MGGKQTLELLLRLRAGRHRRPRHRALAHQGCRPGRRALPHRSFALAAATRGPRLLADLLVANVSLVNDVLRLLLGKARQFRQFRRLDAGQIAEGQEALLNQGLDDLRRHVRQIAAPAFGTVNAVGQLVNRHDLDVPADQLAGQANVLSAPANRQRQLVFLHQYDRPPQARVEVHLLDVRRLQGVGNEYLESVVPADDVDALTAQGVDDVLDTAAADADTGADAVNLHVNRRDSDLGAIAGLASDRLDLNGAIGDFRDL